MALQLLQLDREVDVEDFIPHNEINFFISVDAHLLHLIISLEVLTRTSNSTPQFLH